MEINQYTAAYFDSVFEIIHKTITETYPRYYPQSAVDFFHKHHSKENMNRQLPGEFTLVLFEDKTPIGTATLAENEVKRFFILPEHQGKGYGKALLQELEKNIDTSKYDELILDSSLGAVNFYHKNGYTYKNYKTITLPDDNYLCYLEMTKNICEDNLAINYDNKIFTSLENSGNGEVSGETMFYYHQKKEILWAEYHGGKIKQGFIAGIVKKNGELEFVYEHINNQNEIKTGKCRSTPKITKDEKIELTEKWEWTNGDKSTGESKIKEYETKER